MPWSGRAPRPGEKQDGADSSALAQVAQGLCGR